MLKYLSKRQRYKQTALQIGNFYFKIINKTNEYKLPNRDTLKAPLIFKIPTLKIAKAFLGGGK